MKTNDGATINRWEIEAAFKELFDGLHQESGSMTPSHVFAVVQSYLEYSYWCGVDPLEGLRKSCPFLIWEWHEYPENSPMSQREMEKSLLGVLQKADFFWVSNTSCTDKWVTARRKEDAQHLQLCGCFSRSPFFNDDGSFSWKGKIGKFLNKSYARSLALLHPSQVKDLEKS